MKFLYQFFTYLYVIPLSRWIYSASILGKRKDGERLGLGLTKLGEGDKSIWLVASSVGEVNIANKLIERLKSVTENKIILTVTTATGRRHAEQAPVKADVICYHPLDIGPYVRKFIRSFDPSVVVLIETELWPTLMEETLSKRVRLMQVSGRISANSLRRYLPFKPLFRPLLERCEALLMQSDEDASRLRQIAGDEAKIEVIGSVKGEYVAPEEGQISETRSYLSGWKDTNIFTCGSTRDGEESTLLEAFQLLARQDSRLRIIIAPRHPERLTEVEALIQRTGLTYLRRSTGSPDDTTQVILLDTMGELNLFYHCSDIAFVGGTLAPIGGHNLLEPALAGCPVLYGPYFANQVSSHDLLSKLELGHQVANAADIVQRIESYLAKGDIRSRVAVKVKALRRENATIVDTYVKRILGF